MKHLIAVPLSLAVVVALSGVQGCGSDDKKTSNTGDASSGGNGGATGGAGGTSATGGGGGVGTGGIPLDAWSPEATGSACTTPADCYDGFDGGTLSGPIECITRVTNGYCTHQCNTDSDCCAAAGECVTGLKQVCAPFENTGYKVCFLSCEAADIAAPDGAPLTLADGAVVSMDPAVFCQEEANPEFACRSTGGGVANRQVCMPAGTPGDGGRPLDASTDGPVSDGASMDSGG
jgi:hypothetical protein